MGRAVGLILLSAVAGLGVLFLTLPLVGLMWRAYQEGAWALVPGEAVFAAVRLSFITTTHSLLLTLLLGTPLAYVLARWRFPGKTILAVLVQLPIVLPPAVAGLALLVTFGRRGLLGPLLLDLGWQVVFTQTAVIIAQTFVAMPFYIRAAQIGFGRVNREIEAAAEVDGATPLLRFLLITLPLSARALVSGTLLSWARALGEFGATILFAGSLAGRTQTMPLLIYNVFERDVDAAIWTALLLVGVAALVMTLAALLGRSETDAPDV